MNPQHYLPTLKMLASEPRLKILTFLRQQRIPCSVGSIAEGTGMSPKKVSAHLQHFIAAELVVKHFYGRYHCYTVDVTEIKRLQELIDYFVK